MFPRFKKPNRRIGQSPKESGAKAGTDGCISVHPHLHLPSMGGPRTQVIPRERVGKVLFHLGDESFPGTFPEAQESLGYFTLLLSKMNSPWWFSYKG